MTSPQSPSASTPQPHEIVYSLRDDSYNGQLAIGHDGRAHSRSTTKGTRSRRRVLPEDQRRTPNAFILFRSWFVKSGQVPPEVVSSHSELSTIAGIVWRETDQKPWFDKADDAYRQRYPKAPGPMSRRVAKPSPIPVTERHRVIVNLFLNGVAGEAMVPYVRDFDQRQPFQTFSAFEEPVTTEQYEAQYETAPKKRRSARKATPVKTESTSTITLPSAPEMHIKLEQPYAYYTESSATSPSDSLMYNQESFEQPPALSFCSFTPEEMSLLDTSDPLYPAAEQDYLPQYLPPAPAYELSGGVAPSMLGYWYGEGSCDGAYDNFSPETLCDWQSQSY
ncbi:hypothetical protein CYLTODRAFT_421252 [Cylindrobasidium torrendii FP15055 ss-10]|uniref:HMG box domain-containing protein n=1 Tax=Cylindrobasidium torrendii FP15055 ss-10 TaxID=1314674 RepID=A0A0D7BEE5_9AGAR|nr:hypothetical protein CYLTODRAFT_421252 [Cylindrobasidium torrendii FP15055 ss-10]